jgi:SpoVK/Ycf46/Vps4 family AAA+-type ATPase
MMADEMSDTRNRGRIVWILASSRPDLIEVDLKRPGRIDVKLPIFPSADAKEGFALIRSLCAKRGLALDEGDFARLEARIPPLLTPGAAEALAVKVYRATRLEELSAVDALESCLASYQSPVSAEVMQAQIGLAVEEATDLGLVPDRFRV